MSKKPQPLALKAAIPGRDAAIKFAGGKGESAQVVLDVYIENEKDLPRLLDLRGKRLIVVFTEESQGMPDGAPSIELPAVEPINLDDHE